MQTRDEMRHHIAVLVARNVEYGAINAGANQGETYCLRAEDASRKDAADQLEKVLGYLDELYENLTAMVDEVNMLDKQLDYLREKYQ